MEYIMILMLVLISQEGASQQDIQDRNIDSKWLNDLYLAKTGSPREYIDGKDYFPYYFRSAATPLLRYGEKRTASLTIHGRTYSDLSLQYDTYSDEVIYADDSLIYNNRVCRISLNKEYVSRFDLFFRFDTLHFRYFSRERDTTFSLPEGFYEVAYEKTAKYLIRHVSTADLSPDKIETYRYNPVNYIQVGDSFAVIVSRRQFISLFGDKSEEISHFLHQKHIRIKKAGKEQIKDVLKYYEALLTDAV